MPIVFISPDKDACSDEFLEALKEAIRLQAATELSVPKRKLSPDDFGFKFLEPHALDEPLSDIDIIILAHEYRRRVDKADDIAKSIGNKIAETIEQYFSHQASEVTFSVTLMLGAIGYYSGSARAQQTNSGSR